MGRLEHLFTALAGGEEIDVDYTRGIMDALFALLGENHKLTKAYQEELQMIQSS